MTRGELSFISDDGVTHCTGSIEAIMWRMPGGGIHCWSSRHHLLSCRFAKRSMLRSKGEEVLFILGTDMTSVMARWKNNRTRSRLLRQSHLNQCTHSWKQLMKCTVESRRVYQKFNSSISKKDNSEENQLNQHRLRKKLLSMYQCSSPVTE